MMSYNLIQCICGCIYAEADGHNCNKVTEADRIKELEANINIKADFIDATMNQLAASGQRIEELKAKLAEVKAERDAAMREALALATTLHRNHYSDVPQWEPLKYPAGVISQIDNMVAGIVARALPTPTAAELMARIQTGETDE